MSLITHTVAQRENLTKIAEKYGTTINKLMELNPEIKNANLIFQGQTLTINKTGDDAIGLDTFTTTQKQQTEQTFATTPQQTEVTHSQSKDYDWAWGVAGGAGAVAAWEAGKWAAPYAKSAAETGYLRALYAKDAVKAGANKALNTAGNATRQGGMYIADKAKHIAKGAELEYALGKNAVKNATKKAVQFIMENGTKVGKFLGKAAPWVAGVIALKEVKDAAEEGRTDAAVKQAVKSAGGFGGGIAGAKLGAMAGACTGPAAPIAVPVLTIVGSITGYILGEKIFS